MDEVFVDLCRQMLRRDDVHQTMLDMEEDAYHTKWDNSGPSGKKKKRNKRRDHSKCVVL